MDLPAQLQQQLAKITDSPAYKFFVNEARLPGNLRNTTPPEVNNTLKRWLLLKALPSLRLGKVYSEQGMVGEAVVYRIHIHSPGRHYHLIVTPFLAYMMGKSLAAFRGAGIFKQHKAAEVMLPGDESFGELLLPVWAVDKVIDEFMSIIKENESKVRLQVEEMQRLFLVEQQQEESDEDVPAETRVLH